MKKCSLGVILFSLFLILISVRGYAEITIIYPWEFPTDTTIYSPNKMYRFNVTVCDSEGYSNISTVLFEWNNEPNITVTDSFNITENCSIFSINKIYLSANESGWNYKWYANNTIGETVSLNDNYTITKAIPDLTTIKLYIDGLTLDKTIIYPEIAEIRGNTFNISGGDDLIFNLYRDDELLGSGNVTNQTVNSTLLSNETYIFVYNTTGGTNWTNGSSETRILYVNKGPTNILLWLDGTEGSRSYNLNDPANFTAQVNVTGLTVNLTSPNYPNWIQQNGTTTVYNETTLSSEGIYNITAYTEGNDNYEASSTTYYFDTKGPDYSIINPTPQNNSVYSPNQNYLFNITITDADFNTVIFKFYNKTETGDGTINYTNIVTNYVSINQTTRIYYVNLTDLPAGAYNYSWYVNDTTGKENTTGNLTYIVQKADALSLSASETAVTEGTSTTVTCINSNENAGRTEVNETLKLEADDVINPHTYNLPVGTWIYYCTAPDTGNYTNIGKSITIVVSQQSSSSSNPSSGDTGTPTGSFLITNLPSSLTVGADEEKSTKFNLSNTLDVGTLTNVTISVTGISSSWYSLSSSKITYLYRNKPQTVTITFNIPETAEAKDYDVTVTAKGTIIGSTTTRTATKTMELTVTSPQPTAPIEAPEGVEENAFETTQENITSNTTTIGPTGLAATFEYLRNNLIIVIAIASCLLIFIFRNDITTGLMKAGGKKVPKKTEKTKAMKSPKFSLPSFKNYKLVIDLKGVRGKRTKALEEEPKEEVKRPEVLEREIKRDIKELQQVLETEKKIEKKKKKLNLDNN
jgi:hypothetical protein